MKNSLVMISLLTLSSATVWGSENCYQLNERNVDLCITQKNTTGDHSYKYIDVKIRSRDTGRTIFYSKSFMKIFDEPSLDKNKLVLGMVMEPDVSQTDYMGLEKFMRFKVSPIQFAGQYDFDLQREVGLVKIGTESFTYSKSSNSMFHKSITLGKR